MNKKLKQNQSPKYTLVILFSFVATGLFVLYRFYSFSSTSPITVSTTETESGQQNLPNLRNNEVKKKKKIAYAITVTKDGHFVDGALVLGYSAKKVHDASSGYISEYDADLIAFVVPSVKYARPVLEAYGWKVLERNLPVALDEIQNKAYADGMRKSGCCGADEFLKLWMYTLVDYERVVHLDMDSIIYQNMVTIQRLFYINDFYSIKASQFIYIFVCMCALYIFLSVCMYVCLYVHLSVRVSVYLCIHMI